MKFNVMNRYTGEVEFTAEIDCDEGAEASVKLRLAVLWAKENDANLGGANLSYADLCGADLRYADLSYAVGYIVGAQRTDGYRFDVRLVGEEWRVVAGCRTWNNWTTDQYRKHTEGYGDERKRAETLSILDYLDARIAMEKNQ